jgi:outer membrane protein TolC
MNKLLKILFLVFATCLNGTGLFSASEDSGSNPGPETRALTVQEAVRMTLSHSPDVLMAEAQALRAKEALRESRSTNRPRVVAGTGLAYNNGMPLSIEGAAPSIFQVNASQPIFSKKNNNLIREAEESGKASQLSMESVRNELASKTALVYYDLFRAREAVVLASGRLKAAQKQQEEIETLLEAGRVRPVEVTLAKNAALLVGQQLLVAREQAKVAEQELRELTGLPESTGIETVKPQIESPLFSLQDESIFQQALSSSSEILRAETDVKAKEFHVNAERGEFLPQIAIVSQYALLSRANNYDEYFKNFIRHNYLIGLSIQMPIFNGSGTSARVAQSRQAASEARLNLQRMKSKKKLDIQRRSSDLRIARGEADLARNSVEAAREMVQVNQALMEGGRLGSKEMEDIRSQLLEKELALLDADQILFQRKLELLHSAGSLLSAIQ